MLEPVVVGSLMVWGTIVGVDLVSFPQAMLNRPLVAASVTGFLIGDLEAGLRLGMLLECFALDVMPIGATRYPDFGPASVVATAAAPLAGWHDATGLGVMIALLLALVGGRAMEFVRRLNGRLARVAAPALASGDPAVLARLQRTGLQADALRSLTVTLVGLLAAWLVLPWLGGLGDAGRALRLVAVAGALVAALTGAVRRAGGGVPRVLLSFGMLVGGLLAWLA
jgi:mannose/fructose/N-acetylgalactosamine-specific phosphotransferase system component IIC